MTSPLAPRVVVQKILNHVETGVTAVYDRYSYDNEKRVALDGWGRLADGRELETRESAARRRTAA